MAFLLDDILLSPANFAVWVGRKVYEHAEASVTDESPIRQGLLDLQTQFELGQISADEFAEQETALMARLEAIQRYRESRAS